MATFETAYKKVKRLVKDFKESEVDFLSPDYTEARVRDDFIDEFFTALGWDVTHIYEKNPHRQEVKIEKSIADENKRKRRADYAFSLTPNYKKTIFIIEAKKPARDLLNADDYLQAIRYATNTNTPIVVLTDFEEFHIVDARFKTTIDTALHRKIKEYRYQDYANKEKFAEIYYLFSREAVADNSIQEYSDSLPIPKSKADLKTYLPKGTKSVDDSLLDELEEIRKSLAKAFKKENPSLDSYELTEATQRTIDRLVFLRFLEDKLLEPDLFVSRFARSKSPWKDFSHDCIQLNEKYNGVVFRKHFIDESSFKPPAAKIFIDVCNRLTNPDYYYDVIPIHILGSIYERFLGSIVHATAKQATVEVKPEVKKAGGIYYTPEYIVEYIIKNTIGKLIEGKSPLQISRMHFADIACGSGSFLISVFGYILDYHSNWYNDSPQKAKEDGCIYINEDDKWVLSLRQKRVILVNNIYGVDIDEQAVEVTELSLYLKLLEDETNATAHEMSYLFTLLPDLSNNIICGNSLVEPDILLSDMFSVEGERKLNPMAFDNAFPDVKDKGGFDAIVGNPPYVRVQNLKYQVIDYYNKRYKSCHQRTDLYLMFVEKGIEILKPKGRLAYICPILFTNSDYGKGLRQVLLKYRVEEIVDFSALPVFKDAITYTAIFTISKDKPTDINYHKIASLENITVILDNLRFSKIPIKHLSEKDWVMAPKSELELLEKLYKQKKLQDLAVINSGCFTGLDEVFFVEDTIINEHKLEKELIYPVIMGKEPKRYNLKKPIRKSIYPYQDVDGKTELIPERELKKNFPNIYSYLKLSEKNLRNRKDSRRTFDEAGKPWYSYTRKGLINIFQSPKILVGYIVNDNTYCLDLNQNIFSVGRVFAIATEKEEILKILLGILNSSLSKYLMVQKCPVKQGGYFKISSKYLNEFPIPNFESSSSDKIIQLVEQVMEANKILATATSDRDKNYYERRSTSIDREINKEVYKLYSLSKVEIEIINAMATTTHKVN